MIGTGNRWAIQRTEAPWIESRTSGIRHYLDWRENVLLDHDDPRLLAQSGSSRQFSLRNFDEAEFKWATEKRRVLGLTNSDLASENSEDAITRSVFRFLEKCPDAEWWTLFGFESVPAVSYWPRKASSQDIASIAYRSAGNLLEPLHRADQRSEIDVLLSTEARLVLLEAKWSSNPVSARNAPISRDAATNEKILEHLMAAGASVTGRSIENVISAGGYQVLRHSLYCEHLERSGRWVSVDLVYVFPEPRVAGLVEWSDRFEIAKQPMTITWNGVLAAVPSAWFGSRVLAAPIHRPATPLDYFGTRRLSGKPAPLV